MIHLYAFVEGLDELPVLAGIAGAPVDAVSVDGVSSVFSRHVAQGAPGTLRDDALAHGAVVEALVPSATAVLPVRFGERVPDEAALAESVRSRAPVLRATFDRVRGCAELAVRVWAPTDVPAAFRAATGTEYMQRRNRTELELRRPVDELRAQLKALARDERFRGGARVDRELLAAAYLVHRTQVETFRDVVVSFAAAQPSFTVVCTGPWAPFSFADAGVPV